jgi:hypothetical protein
VVSGDHSFWITDGNVLDLLRQVGLAETGVRNYDDNVVNWVELVTNTKELPVGEPAEVVAALQAAIKTDAEAPKS